MNLLQTIIPIPIPVHSHGSSGSWTETDTKITISILIVTFIFFLLAIVIEKIRGTSWKNIFKVDIDELTMFSGFTILCSYIIFGIAFFGFLGYFIYTLL
jgi:hypothetical protein